jgi:hypothetical protein
MDGHSHCAGVALPGHRGHETCHLKNMAFAADYKFKDIPELNAGKAFHNIVTPASLKPLISSKAGSFSVIKTFKAPVSQTK